MSNRRIPMVKLKEIIRLKLAKTSIRKIAKLTKVSRNTLVVYLRYFEKAELSLSDLLNLSEEEIFTLVNKRPTVKDDFESQRFELLSNKFLSFEEDLRKPGVTREKLWTDYKIESPNGYGYAQFCHHYQQWKKNSEISLHIEHKAGDKLFVDYAGKKLSIVDKETGNIREVEVFVSILGSSQFTYVEATYTQNKEDFIQSVENSFLFFNGVTKAVVPDNLKSAVTKSCKYEPEINSYFDDFAQHYNTSIYPARVRKPQDKSLVEGAVKIIYRRIYAELDKQIFFSLQELNTAIKEKLEIHNNMKFQNRNYSRYDLYIKIEKAELLELPPIKYELKEYRFYTVQMNSHIRITKDDHYYSVPYKYIGKKVKVAFSTSTVEIYLNYKRISFHKRVQSIGYSTLAVHMPSKYKYLTEWNPKRFISWAEKIGEKTKTVIETILSSKIYPEQAYKSCFGILSLAKKVGEVRLESACARANDYNNCNYRVIKNILEQKLDEEKVEQQTLFSISQDHQNIRGASYYK